MAKRISASAKKIDNRKRVIIVTPWIEKAPSSSGTGDELISRSFTEPGFRERSNGTQQKKQLSGTARPHILS
jgi:hypothetical protein